jgi:hypothetical protein
MDTHAICAALDVIRVRLVDVHDQCKALEDERDCLLQAEQSLAKLIDLAPKTTAVAIARDPPDGPGRRAGTLRSKLLACLEEAGPSGRTFKQIREEVPDAKSASITATLSNLKRAGLVYRNHGVWFSGEAMPPISSEPTMPDRQRSGVSGSATVNGRGYEIVTHPRTGVSLARAAGLTVALPPRSGPASEPDGSTGRGAQM